MLDTRLSFYGSFPEERGYSVIATIKLVKNCGYKQLQNGSVDKVMMSKMGTQGFSRYLTFKMASCDHDSPSVKPATCKFSRVCHISKILATCSCGFSLFKLYWKPKELRILALGMPSEHPNCPYNVTSCSSLQLLHYTRLKKHPCIVFTSVCNCNVKRCSDWAL